MKIPLVLSILVALTMSVSAYTWDKTITLQGRGVRQSCVFPVVGEKWRIRYVPKARGNVKIELLDEDGVAIMTPLNYRNLDMPQTVSGRSNSAIKNVSLRVEGAVNGWTCTFEQYVDEIGGWDIYRWRNEGKDVKRFEKFAMWTGDAGDEFETTVNVTAKKCRLLFETFEPGKVKIELIDSNGKCHLLNYHLDKGESDGWVFAPGEYTLKVTSIGSPWTVSIEVENGFSNSKFVK